MEFKDILRAHIRRYPLMQEQDLVKLCYQAEFGGGHMIADEEMSLARLKAECEPLMQADDVEITPIGGGLCRFDLYGLAASGLDAQTLNRLFVLTANEKKGSVRGLEEKLCLLEKMYVRGELPPRALDINAYLDGYRKAGYPAVSHSQEYRRAYHPAYRLVPEWVKTYLPLLGDICHGLKQGKFPLRVAIDGMSASGKSTLGRRLAAVFDANLFHMDDFFLPADMKTPQRLDTPGGNVHYERFADEILKKDMAKAFTYRPFDCQTGMLAGEISVEPKRLVITEGSYSLHPALEGFYDIKAALFIDGERQLARILKRNGEWMLARFRDAWIPLENAYIQKTQLKERCDHCFIV